MIDIAALEPLPVFSWDEISHREVDGNYFAFYGLDFGGVFGKALEHRFGVMPLAGYHIAVHYFGLPANQKTIVLNHGYYDHVGLYADLIKMLLELGCNVLAYDLPGHGLSSGEVAGIGSFADYQLVLTALMQQARPYLSGPFYIIGQSTGGSIAMDYVMNNPGHGFKKLILLAPLVIPRNWGLLQGVLFTIGWFVDGLPREFSKNSHNEHFLEFVAKEDPLQARSVKSSWGMALFQWQKHFQQSPPSSVPTLVIQGEEDKTVDWRYDLEQIQKKFTVLTVVKLAGARHHLANESESYRPQIFARIAAFINTD